LEALVAPVGQRKVLVVVGEMAVLVRIILNGALLVNAEQTPLH
jgi:hypothetical protein